MRKLIGFALIALTLALTGVSSFAMTKQHTSQVATAPTEIKGEVTYIKGHSLIVKDEAGKIHMVKAADPKALEGIKVGDNVDVKLENGKVVSMRKIEGTTSTQPTAETK
ncbi:MAG: hypothetical protein ACREOW_09760 [Thermodesulfobacteriota bacterium]